MLSFLESVKKTRTMNFDIPGSRLKEEQKYWHTNSNKEKKKTGNNTTTQGDTYLINNSTL